MTDATAQTQRVLAGGPLHGKTRSWPDDTAYEAPVACRFAGDAFDSARYDRHGTYVESYCLVADRDGIRTERYQHQETT